MGNLIRFLAFILLALPLYTHSSIPEDKMENEWKTLEQYSNESFNNAISSDFISSKNSSLESEIEDLDRFFKSTKSDKVNVRKSGNKRIKRRK